MTFLKISLNLRLTELNYIIDTVKTGNAVTTNFNSPLPPFLTDDQKVTKQIKLLRSNVTKNGLYQRSLFMTTVTDL